MTNPHSRDGQAIVEALREQNEIIGRIASSLDSIDRGIFEMNEHQGVQR